MDKRKSILFVVTDQRTYLNFLVNHVKYLSQLYDVSLLFGSFQELTPVSDQIRVFTVPLRRRPHLFYDICSILKMVWIFASLRFDVVHSFTPKAGFLASIAGFIVGIPYRFHTFTGQVWATRSGFSRFFLRLFDLSTSFFCTHCFSDSKSQAHFLSNNGFLKPFTVLGDGSISGVDQHRFRFKESYRREFRDKYGIARDELIILFVGRINRDKGVLDLVEAYYLSSVVGLARLVIVGSCEDDTVSAIKKRFAVSDNVIYTGPLECPEMAMSASDIFCLPSYREGFGTSVIEAASVGLPAIVSEIYGLSDAVKANQTGLFFQCGSAKELAKCIDLLVSDTALRIKLGMNARNRAISLFSSDRLSSLLLEFYVECIGS